MNAEGRRHRANSEHEDIPGDGPLLETERGAIVDRPALDVHGLDLADQHPGVRAQVTKRTDDVAGLDIAGGDLGKHRREQQEVLSGQDGDVGRLRQATSRLDTGIAASDDQHPGSRHEAMLSNRGWGGESQIGRDAMSTLEIQEIGDAMPQLHTGGNVDSHPLSPGLGALIKARSAHEPFRAPSGRHRHPIRFFLWLRRGALTRFLPNTGIHSWPPAGSMDVSATSGRHFSPRAVRKIPGAPQIAQRNFCFLSLVLSIRPSWSPVVSGRRRQSQPWRTCPRGGNGHRDATGPTDDSFPPGGH